MPGGADAGGAVHVKPDVAVNATDGLPGVETHPHPERRAVSRNVLDQGLLGGHRGGHCIPSPGERDEECVPLRVNLTAVPLLERGA